MQAYGHKVKDKEEEKGKSGQTTLPLQLDALKTVTTREVFENPKSSSLPDKIFETRKSSTKEKVTLLNIVELFSSCG